MYLDQLIDELKAIQKRFIDGAPVKVCIIDVNEFGVDIEKEIEDVELAGTGIVLLNIDLDPVDRIKLYNASRVR